MDGLSRCAACAGAWLPLGSGYWSPFLVSLFVAPQRAVEVSAGSSSAATLQSEQRCHRSRASADLGAVAPLVQFMYWPSEQSNQRR